MLLSPSCSLCGKQKNLSRCGACRVTLYCAQDHQLADRPNHASVCKAVIRSRAIVELEEQKLRDFPGDFMTPENPF